MGVNPNLVEVAALIGDPSRGAILTNLMSGRALPASELARVAKITPQTASSHLAKMVEAGLLVTESYGRHRYYRLAGPDVAHALESLQAIARHVPVRSLRESDEAKALRYARTCYDHLAGEVGVALTDKLLSSGYIQPSERNFTVTGGGERVFQAIGISVADVRHSRRHFARQCLDWSERRHHIAGAVGAALTNRMFELDWLVRIPGIRAVRVTETGQRGLGDVFGLTL